MVDGLGVVRLGDVELGGAELGDAAHFSTSSAEVRYKYDILTVAVLRRRTGSKAYESCIVGGLDNLCEVKIKYQ